MDPLKECMTRLFDKCVEAGSILAKLRSIISMILIGECGDESQITIFFLFLCVQMNKSQEKRKDVFLLLIFL